MNNHLPLSLDVLLQVIDQLEGEAQHGREGRDALAALRLVCRSLQEPACVALMRCWTVKVRKANLQLYTHEFLSKVRKLKIKQRIEWYEADPPGRIDCKQATDGRICVRDVLRLVRRTTQLKELKMLLACQCAVPAFEFDARLWAVRTVTFKLYFFSLMCIETIRAMLSMMPQIETLRLKIWELAELHLLTTSHDSHGNPFAGPATLSQLRELDIDNVWIGTTSRSAIVEIITPASFERLERLDTFDLSFVHDTIETSLSRSLRFLRMRDCNGHMTRAGYPSDLYVLERVVGFENLRDLDCVDKMLIFHILDALERMPPSIVSLRIFGLTVHPGVDWHPAMRPLSQVRQIDLRGKRLRELRIVNCERSVLTCLTEHEDAKKEELERDLASIDVRLVWDTKEADSDSDFESD